jgi:hydrogenase expression/formation protein HypE
MASDRIIMAHGGGGRMMDQLIEDVFLPAFGDPVGHERHDGARLDGSIIFTADAYVVRPLFFPGGSIGEIAVFGTANDLAMCGARPRWLSASFILEEGLPIETLRHVVADMGRAAREAEVLVVTGDTKVVERGAADGLYVTTSGVGFVEFGARVGPALIGPGDTILISGPVGAHGVAVLSVREGIAFETEIESDAAPLWPVVEALLRAGVEVHCLRDLTRGGLAAAVNEIARARGVEIELTEASIPVEAPVRAACEFLGLDPFYVANEGCFIAIVKQSDAEKALSAMQRFDPRAAIIGITGEEGAARVSMQSAIGGRRSLDHLAGDLLPRIC